MARRSVPAPRLDPDIAQLAGALAEPSRLAMLDALMDGRSQPIGALARRIGVSAATASGHLRRLVDERLVLVERDGRSHRVRLAGPEVAQLLESFAALAGARVEPGASRTRELRFARTCYDHLAGAVGVAITRGLVERAWLRSADHGFAPAPDLLAWLADHGHPVADDTRTRRPLSRACLDWSERVPHLAGRLGVALADLALAKQWVVRARDSRAVRLTDRGRIALARELAVRIVL